MTNLDIGCGPKTAEGFEGLDKQEFGQKFIIDLDTELIPLDVNSVDGIRAEHFLEHVRTPSNVLGEMLRVLKVGGIIHLVVPGPKSNGYRQIDHLSHFDEETFKCLYKVFPSTHIEHLVTNSRQDIHVKIKKI